MSKYTTLQPTKDRCRYLVHYSIFSKESLQRFQHKVEVVRSIRSYNSVWCGLYFILIIDLRIFIL
jgi:transposase-like protein